MTSVRRLEYSRFGSRRLLIITVYLFSAWKLSLSRVCMYVGMYVGLRYESFQHHDYLEWQRRALCPAHPLRFYVSSLLAYRTEQDRTGLLHT